MKEAKELVEKYEKGLCTPEELELLQKWFHHLGEDEVPALSEEDLLTARHNFAKNAERHIRPIGSLSKLLKVAAALILVGVGTSLFLYLASQYIRPDIGRQTDLLNDVAPGTNNATITLPSGQSFQLTDEDHGSIARDAGLLISRTAEGELVYEIVDHNELNKNDNRFSIVKTPRGGQHQIILPDGSRVWLNAASPVKFPAGFYMHDERTVELTGEAYFEVARDESRPFIVKSEGQEVKVLGTSFNIDSYKDEGITKTTLIEGSVQIRNIDPTGKKGDQVILVPGEQALLSKTGFQINQIDLRQATDWRNGDLIFQQEALAQILTKVARWYDIDVIYSPHVDRIQTFSGQVSRSKNLSEVLMILEATGQVQFRISGKQVIASK